MPRPSRKPWSNKKCINYSLATFSVIVIVAVAAVAVATIFMVSEQNAMQRYCIDVDDGGLLGAFWMNSNDRTMSWNFQNTPTTIGAITSIQIKGPIPTGSLDGPLTVALCGSPHMISCDTSVPGESVGTMTADVSLKTVITEMREKIWRYYIELNDGSTTLRAPLISICGTP